MASTMPGKCNWLKNSAHNLKLHSQDQGVRPVPVEIMDRNGDFVLDWNDVILDIYTVAGDKIGSFPPEQIYIPDMIYSGLFPYYDPFDERMVYFDTDGDGCYSCQGDNYPPQMAFIIPHFEWGDNAETDPTSWYASWNQKMSELSMRWDYHKYSQGTTYAHLFKQGDRCVIQYWFYYPFNGCANQHEGDWEHINAILNSQNPSTVQIVKVVYYYHHSHLPVTNPELISQTHPRVYVGGYMHVNTGGQLFTGHGSHGSYPHAGHWSNVGALGMDEDVDGSGMEIDFGNYGNIVIMPNAEFVNNGHNNIHPYIDSYRNDLNWMVYNNFWGQPLSHPSAGESWFSIGGGILQYSLGAPLYYPGVWLGWWDEIPDNAGNVAPMGPVQHSSWEGSE